MIKLALTSNFSPILKHPQYLKLTGLARLERVNITAMPSAISNSDISAMFNGLLNLIKDKLSHEQNAKYLQLKLEYSRLQYLYNKLRVQFYKK